LEIASGAGDAAADRAEGYVADLGGVGVRQPEHLGEHEGGAPVRFESAKQVVRGDGAGGIGYDLDPCGLQAGEQATSAGAAAQRIGAGATRDAEQPHPERRPRFVRRERLQRAQVRLLGEVVSREAVNEVGAQLTDLTLGRAHERGDGDGIAVARGLRPPRELVHQRMMPSGPVPDVARNFPDPRGDLLCVSCEQVRVGLSARLDGEDPGLPVDELDRHLEACLACSAWQAGAADVSRRVRLRTAEPAADLASSVAEALRDGTALQRSPRRVARALLALTALLQLGLSLPALLLGEQASAGLHVAREIGATEVALAVGVLCAAWRPWRCAGMLPVVAALAVGLASTTLIDVVGGEVPALHEVPHLLALVEAALLWHLRHAAIGNPTGSTPATQLSRVA
jgi:predicted anti-sigma-YlaC factor YlaD